MYFLLATFVISCRKDEEIEATDNEIVAGNFEADFMTESDVSEGLIGAQSQNGYAGRLAEVAAAQSCGSIQLISGSPTNFPIVFKINFWN